MRVVVIHDDVPAEAPPDQRDSLVQVEAVSAALRELGHVVSAMPCGLDLSTAGEALRRSRPDLIFNLVESVGGDGRLLYLAPALFDSLDLPYTGGSTESLFLTTGKVLAKRFLRSHGLPTPDWFTLDGESERAAVPFRPGRYIVKSIWEEASVGLHDDCVVDAEDVAALQRLIEQHARDQGGSTFAERFIEGREFNLSVLGSPEGPMVLPPAEMLFVDYPEGKPKIVNYAAKWDENAFEFHHTPRRFDVAPADRGLTARLVDLAQRCWDLFGVRGYARVDFRVDAAGNPWILELNVNPCISPDAGFIAAASVAGLTYRDVIERILADVPRHRESGSPSRPSVPSRCEPPEVFLPEKERPDHPRVRTVLH